MQVQFFLIEDFEQVEERSDEDVVAQSFFDFIAKHELELILEDNITAELYQGLTVRIPHVAGDTDDVIYKEYTIIEVAFDMAQEEDKMVVLLFDFIGMGKEEAASTTGDN